MTDEAKAVTAVANTTEKGLEIVQNFGKFLSNFLEEPLGEVSGILTDKFSYMRTERKLRLMEKYKQLLIAQGMDAPTRPIAPKFLVPLLQGAVWEEDDDLQDVWIKMLFNAGDSRKKVDYRRQYIDILERVSVYEVKIMSAVYSLPFEEVQYEGVVTSGLPETVVVCTSELMKSSPDPSHELQLAVSHLSQLNCLAISMTWSGGEVFNRVMPTVFGRSFVNACTLS